MTKKYDSAAGIADSAMHFRSTIIPMVIDGPEFWVFLVFNIFVVILRKYGIIHPAQWDIDLPWGLTGVTGSLMTFFVVFYNSHIFSRYNRLYEITKKMSEQILMVTAMLRVHVTDKQLRIKVTKLMLASAFIFFFERSGQGDDTISKIEWGQLLENSLLEKDEYEGLQHHCDSLDEDAIPGFLCLQWCMELLKHHTDDPADRDDMLTGFFVGIHGIWRCQTQVVEILELPMPFQYFHIMNLMLLLNLLLWAYALGCQDSYFAPLIYMFVQMMFQGVRELSTALSDPYGSDEVDFPVNDWMISLYARVWHILQTDETVQEHCLSGVGQNVLKPPSKMRHYIDVFVDRK